MSYGVGMEASCESAKRDELRPRVLGNVVKIIIKAVTTPYYLFVRLTRVPSTPRTAVQGLARPPEVAAASITLTIDRRGTRRLALQDRGSTITIDDSVSSLLLAKYMQHSCANWPNSSLASDVAAESPA